MCAQMMVVFYVLTDHIFYTLLLGLSKVVIVLV